jgi:hypothetical protein
VFLFCNTFTFLNNKVVFAKCYLILDIKLASINIVEDKANAKASNNAFFEDNRVIFAKVKLINNNAFKDKAKFELININIAKNSKGY